MNFIVEWFIKRESEGIVGKLLGLLDGKKTYIIAALGIVIALIGHFWGPVHIGDGLDIPQLSWNQVWNIVWNGGLISALRNGVAKTA